MREIDRVRVKGKFQPVKIFEPARHLTNRQKNAWSIYNKGVQLFLNRAWDEAEKLFIKSLELLDGKDYLSEKYITDTRACKASPPGDDWDGVAIMTHK
jgi:adenylate cyclase